MLASHLSGHPSGLTPNDEERLSEAVRRAQVIRAAILAAGIQLPPLRDIAQRDEPSEDLQELTIGQIARWSGLDRGTVLRRLRRLGGELLQRYIQTRAAGSAAKYTVQEAGLIVEG